MRYKNTVKGRFISRPNRFEAYVEVDGEERLCHVKNTGRCRELLKEGAEVILEKAENPKRKTSYDLVAVYKGDILINMDSQAPNKVFADWIRNCDFFGEITYVKPECKYKNSRFDFYLENMDGSKIFVEVKGVTLENDGVVLFPDAPTERGVKHINELMESVSVGYEAYVFFIIQMKPCKYFMPNRETHKEFAEALERAQASGVKICALNCEVTEDGLGVFDFVEVKLNEYT